MLVQNKCLLTYRNEKWIGILAKGALGIKKIWALTQCGVDPKELERQTRLHYMGNI